jgi:hypothetical protein
MKLRLRSNTLRLRLNQHEVGRLAQGLTVEEVTPFPGAQQLKYSVALGTELGARFESGHIRVTIPQTAAATWFGSDQVGIEGTVEDGHGASLRVLVEKDFACLKPRPEEEDENAFPHPEAGAATCN